MQHRTMRTTCSKMLQLVEGGCVQPVVMPLDLVVQLSQRTPLHCMQVVSTPNLLQSYRDQPAAPSLLALRSVDQAKVQQFLLEKKHVMFADAKGLPLTTVHYFSDPEEPTSSDSEEGQEVAPSDGAKKKKRLGQRRRRLQLGFHQPSVENLENLERCDMTSRVLTGTVRVRNPRSEKNVHIRATFDSWRSYCDIPCTPLRQSHRGGETGTFAFTITLPLDFSPTQRLEYYVYERVGSTMWGDNMGQNLVQEMPWPTATFQARDAGHWLNHPVSNLLVTRS